MSHSERLGFLLMRQYSSFLWIAFQSSILALDIEMKDPDPALKELAGSPVGETASKK